MVEGEKFDKNRDFSKLYQKKNTVESMLVTKRVGDMLGMLVTSQVTNITMSPT